MIGDDDIEATIAGMGDRLVGGDAIIDGDDQANAVVCKAIDNARVNAIPVVHPAGDGVVDIRTKAPQRPQQQRRTGHTVSIVVAANGDFLVIRNRVVDQVDRDL